MGFRFKEVFENTHAALEEDASTALATFEAQSRLADGFRSNVSIRQFEVGVDEPPALAGRTRLPIRSNISWRRWDRARKSHTGFTRTRSAFR